MDEQQVKALLKRMAQLEAENASLKQQAIYDKKDQDEDPRADEKEKNVRENKVRKIKSEASSRKRSRDVIEIIEDDNSNDNVNDYEEIEAPPTKKRKTESVKRKPKTEKVIDISDDLNNEPVYIDNNGYWKKWATQFAKKVKTARFYEDLDDDATSTIEVIDKEISKDDFYDLFKGKGRRTHNNTRIVFSTWEDIEQLFRHNIAPLHVAWIWQRASKETFWGGIETKPVKMYQSNVKIDSLIAEYNHETKCGELTFECIATEENNENSNIEINKSMNLLDFLASQSAERQQEIFAEANKFKRQKSKKFSK